MPPSAEAIVELLNGRRMVLSIQCGEGDLLARLADRGVPGVGIDTLAANIETCRTRQFPSWIGTWQVVAAHRKKFDGIHVPLERIDSLDDVATLITTLAAGLLPRGLLILSGRDDLSQSIPAILPSELEVHSKVEDIMVLARQSPATPRTPGDTADVLVGPYANAIAQPTRTVARNPSIW